jgi:hypothetical protein
VSGEAVGFPLAPVALLGGMAVAGAGIVVAAVVLPGSMAARAIRSFVDSRVEAAQREAEIAKARLEDWRRGVATQASLQAEEAQRMEVFSRAVERLAAGEMTGPRKKERAEASSVRALMAPPGTSEDVAAVAAVLSDVGAVLAALAKTQPSRDDSPVSLLHDRKRNLELRLGRGEPILAEEANAFRSLVYATLKDHRESEERRSRHRAELLVRAGIVLGEALRIREFTIDAGVRSDIEPAISELAAMPGADRLSGVRLDAIEAHIAAVKKRAESALEEAAARRVLEESVTRHLSTFGYEVLQEFAAGTLGEPRRAKLSVPGGEQVWVTLQENGALAFRLVHEGRSAGTSVMEHFLPEFKRQESKWCADLKRLFSCLAGDGFPYEIRFERPVPDGGVQVVYVEDAGGWETERIEKAPARRAKAKMKLRREPE